MMTSAFPPDGAVGNHVLAALLLELWLPIPPLVTLYFAPLCFVHRGSLVA
jgi:hypothetical protein